MASFPLRPPSCHGPSPTHHHPRGPHPRPRPARRPRPAPDLVSPPSVSSSRPCQPRKGPRAAVPFNRLQLAAALIEYDDEQVDDEASGIDWSLQELPAQIRPPRKRAPYSAIFIPFRETAGPRPLNFLSGIAIPEPPSPPRSPSGLSNSGFGLVSELDGAARSRLTRDGLAHGPQAGNQTVAEDPDVEVLSEWGMDKLLLDPSRADKSKSEQACPSDPFASGPQHPERDRRLQLKTGRLQTLDRTERSLVKSDLFDLNFSDLRTRHVQAAAQRDFLALPNSASPLGAGTGGAGVMIDDEQLMRQRAWCDSEGRQLLRPRSVMELKETQRLHQRPRNLGHATTGGSSHQIRRHRARLASLQLPHSAPLLQSPLKAGKNRSHLRSKSLSLVQEIALGSPGPQLTSFPTFKPLPSGSGAHKPSPQASGSPRGRRKSTLDEPFDRQSSLGNPLQGVLGKRLPRRRSSLPLPSISSPLDSELAQRRKSSQLASSTAPLDEAKDRSDPKLKKRTSADIAQRYRQSLALIERHRAEDAIYADPQEAGAATNAEHESAAIGSTDDGRSTFFMNSASGDPSRLSSDFSLGAPRQFTSRFDPKVASVLSRAQASVPSEHNLDGDRESLSDVEHQGGDFEEALEQVDEKPIFDESGRIRFPMSLKPLVLIMPIPLTPEDVEPEQEDGAGEYEVVDADESEEAKVNEVFQQQRPAGKLYGRSLIDELNARKGTQKSRQKAFAGDDRPKMFSDFLSPSDASGPESLHSSLSSPSGVQLALPRSPNSSVHLANQAMNITQSRFSQALISSSKARKSVFGMDMIMKAELAKLQKIKEAEAREEKELKEREAKKPARKWGLRKKRAMVDVEGPKEALDDVENRVSHLNDNWDAVLERQIRASVPSALPAYTSTPLPVISTPKRSPVLVGNMEDWFGDKITDLLELSPASVLPPPEQEEAGEQEEFASVAAITHELELRAGTIKYSPVANVFDGKVMKREHSICSEAALLSHATRGNTPVPVLRGIADSPVEGDDDDEPLVSVARHQGGRQSQAHRASALPDLEVLLDKEDEQDDVPLSHYRNSVLAMKADESDDDNRPLSLVGSKVLSEFRVKNRLTNQGEISGEEGHLSTGSQAPRSSSPHETDEDLPLGIRASILLSRTHPPVDLTHEVGCSESPIGSVCSDESDDVPLAARASSLWASNPLKCGVRSQCPQPGPSMLDVQNGDTLSDDDNVPLGLRASAHLLPGPQPVNAVGQSGGSLAAKLNPKVMAVVQSSNKSISGQSDDVPLGLKYEDDIPLGHRLSSLNPLFSLGGRASLNPPYVRPEHPQLAQMRGVASNAVFQDAADDGSEDDHLPLALKYQAKQKGCLVEADRGRNNIAQTAAAVGPGAQPALAAAVHQGISAAEEVLKEGPDTNRAFPADGPPNDAEKPVATQDALVVLQGTSDTVEEHVDGNVSLALTMAAHTSSVEVLKQDQPHSRSDSADSGGAAGQQSQYGARIGIEEMNGLTARDEKAKERDEDHDDDDVPLGLSHHHQSGAPSQILQQQRMGLLVEQQNRAFEYAMMNAPVAPSPWVGAPPCASVMNMGQHLSTIAAAPTSTLTFPSQAGFAFPPHGNAMMVATHPAAHHAVMGHLPPPEFVGSANVESIARWREDVGGQ